jgi:hypothetical protein
VWDRQSLKIQEIKRKIDEKNKRVLARKLAREEKAKGMDLAELEQKQKDEAQLAIDEAKGDDKNVFDVRKETKNKNKCGWSEVDKKGNTWHCTNDKCVHPGTSETLRHCFWHTPNCVADHGGQNIKVQKPNGSGYCNNHHLSFKKKAPDAIEKFRVPGVHRLNAELINSMNDMASGSAYMDPGNEITESTVCNWVWTNKKDLKRYGCTNKVFRHPKTGILQKVCAYHTAKCLLPHPMNIDGVEIDAAPNDRGLCHTHYIGETGVPMKKFADPSMVPGVQRLQKRLAQLKPRHQLAPKTMHPDDLDMAAEDAG